MQTLKSNPFVCQRCATLGATCCSTVPENLEFCFPISSIEMQAIQDHSALDIDYFVSMPNSTGFVQQLSRLLPDFNVQHVFASTKTHWRLAVTPEGHCIFLKHNGCSLKRSLRPYYCRLFPFWVYEKKLTWFTMPQCLAHQENLNLQAMLQALNTDEQTIYNLFTSMCHNLGLKKHL